MKRALFLLTMLTALSWSVTNAQVSKTFACNFENATDTAAWTFINGSAINQWHIDTATNNGSGSHAMYISNDNGATNTYTNSQATSFVIAYHEVYIMGGTTTTLSFDWKAWGESNYDYLRVALIPVDFNFTPNTIPPGFSSSTLPTGWIPLDGGAGLCNSSNWQTQTRIDTVQTSGYYRLAFIWKNDHSMGTQPPAAIDNVTFSYTESSCLPPTNLTISSLTPNSATIHWDESASSTATGYGIWMYTSPITDFVNTGLYYTGGIGAGGTSWIFSDEFVDPYTQYYAYVRTGCGDSHSEFVEISFHTPPTCAIPLNPQVTIQNKSTATLSWTPGDNSQASNYEYVLSTSPLTADQLATSGPNVSGITETSVELTNLTPEATYYLYLRNNCGGTDPSPYADAVAFTMPLACSAVRNLTATNITTNSFTLSWENENWETSGRWAVEINDGADGNYLVMGPPTLSLSGLTPGTAYTVTVSTECGDIYAESVTIVVNTLNDGDIAIGEQIHIYKDNKIPVDNYYKYSYTQQIFTASELQAGKITKIAFQYLYDQPMTKVTDATIYLGHTTKNAFSSTTDWVSFSDLTPVYTGSMNCTQGWNTFELSTPFAYNGTDNLVIAVHKNADNTAYDGNQYVFAANSTSQPKTLYYHNDNNDCSPEDPVEGTRLSNRNIVRITFTDVRHDPVTVDLEHPYNDDFEGELQWDLYQGSCVNAWAQGTATHNGEGTKSLYVSNNGGADNNYSINKSATIYAAKQFALAAGQYDIRYDWKAYGQNSYDYLRVALVPASTQLAASTNIPAGFNYNSLPSDWKVLDYGYGFHLANEWNRIDINNLQVDEDGIYMVVFIWRNNNSQGVQPPAAIDNFSISRVTCPKPINLQAQNITSQSANLYWEINGQNSESFTYILHNTEYIDTTNTSNYAYATGTNTTVQNLNPYTNYFYTVKANCGADGQSRWTEPTHFMTMPDCGEQGVRQFALGTQPNTGNSYPAYNYSSATYGANWMIFTADEIMEEAEFTGAIKGLAWRTPQAGGFPFQIYMAQTDKTEFESATDTVDRATMTKVFDGYPDFLANEWSEVVFDTPFEYDATGNLLVMVYRSSSSGNYPFEYSHYNDTKTIYRYGAQGLTSGGTSNNRINTRFTMCVSEDECLPVQNLTISNIRPDSYDFSWTDGRNASVVIYEHAHHVLEGEDPSPLYGFNTLIGDGVYGGTCTGLTPGTTYAHYVRVNCGTSQSQFKKVTITTECNYITLPYTCGFESEDGLPESGSYPIPSCWHRINDATSSTNYYPYVNSSSSYAYHGNNSLLFYTASTSTYADNLLAVLPPVSSNYPMNHNQMTFWAKHYSSYSSTTIQVGTMTDVYDASTFVADTTLQLTSEYREYVARFHSNGIFPAIKMVKTAETQGAYIDDITIEVAPACPKPLYVTADNITSTEASISWTPGGEESLWQIDYMSEDGVSGSSLQTSENPCTITGLMANKTYVIKVRSVCDGNYLSAWSTPFSFRTSCDTYTPLPYTENFDLYTQGITTSSSSSPSYPSGYPNVALPSCWTFPNMATTTSGYPKTYIWKTSDSDRENVLIGNVRKGYGGSWFAVLPKASEDLNNLMLSFSYAGAGNFTTSQYPVLKMGYMTDPTDTTTFHELYVCPPTPSTTQYLHEELLLDTLPAIDAYIAFKAEPWSTSSYQVRIDDIRLEVIPTCFKPTDLSVEDLTHNSIMLSWEDPQDESPLYQIAYGPSSSFDIRYNSTYTITTATTTTCNIAGLQSGTEYSFAVRTKCGDGDWSYWSQTISAKTSCLLTSLPYTENFDSYRRGISPSTSTPSDYPNVDIPDCWTFVNRTKTASGKIFLTKSNDYAVSGNALLMYGNTSTPLYAVLPAFDEPLTNLQISFTYTFSSESATSTPLTLGYMTNPADANTFQIINTYSSNKDFVEVEQLLDEVSISPATGNVHLAFLYPGSANVGIDNICVKEIPACRRPELTLAENWFGSSMIYFNCVNPNAVVNDTFNYQLATGLAETFDLEDASTYTLSNGHATRPTFFNLTWATTPNTKYSFAIRVQCSDNTWSEWSNVVTRKTECNVVDLPYEEYFDTYTQGISTGYNCPSTYPNVDLPECWTIVNASEYRTQKPQAFLTSSHDYSKSGNSLMLYSSEATPVFAMLPKFFEAGGSQPLKISFYYANNTLSNAGTLSIGYLYRNNEYYDTTSFRELYSCPITTDMTYVEHTIDSLPNGARITLRYSSGSSSSGVWIDEVEVVPASTCTQSVSITGVSYISSNRFSVQFDGERLTDGSQYKIACGPAATFDPNDPSTYEHSATFTFGHSYVISDLQPNTEYAIAMAIVCPDWVTGNWSRIVTVKTLCADYTTLPYTEDFNSYTEGVSSSISTPSEYPNVTLPECWSFQNTSYKSPAFLTSDSYYAASGNALVLYPKAKDTIIAILPTFEEDIRNLKLTFSYKNMNSGASYPALSVGYMEGTYNSPVTFHEIAQLERTTSWTYAEVLFDEVPGWAATNYTTYIAIKFASPQYSGRAYIDNVVVKPAICPVPLDLTATNVTAESVSLSWDNPYPASQYEVIYAPTSGVDLEDESYETVTVTSNSATISGLSGNTEYTFAVRAHCDGTDWSNWSSEITAKTLCGTIATLPYIENFDSYTEGVSTGFGLPNNYPNETMPECWTFVNRSDNSNDHPFVILSQYNGFVVNGNALFFRVDTVKPVYAVLPAFEKNIQDLKLSFYYRNEDDNSTNKLSVGYMTDPTDASTFVEVQDFERVTTMTHAEIIFGNVPESLASARIVIKCPTGYIDQYLSIDEVMVEEFTNPCDPVLVNASNPYTDDFESDQCWQLINGTATNAWAWGSATHNGQGEKALYISNNNGTSNDYSISSTSMVFATKLFTLESGLYNFQYDWKAKGESTYDYLRVALAPATTQLTAGSTPSNFSATSLPSGWIALDGGSKLNLNSSWTLQSTNEVPVQGGNYMVVFAWKNDNSGGSNPPAAIDNFSIKLTNCPLPTSILVDNITESGASVSWTSGGDETQWEVMFVDMATLESQTVSSSTSTLNFNLLQSYTSYNVYVRSVCGDGDESGWSGPVSFKTPCPSISLPYTCGFESQELNTEVSRPLPYCWYRYNDAPVVSNNYYPYAYNYDSRAHTGNYSLYFYASNNSQYANHLIAVLPKISVSDYPMNGNQMTLWASRNASPASIIVGTMTNPDDTSTFVADTVLALTPDYLEYVVKFHSTGAFPAIMMLKSSSSQTAYVDDIVIDIVPSCARPLRVKVNDITQTSASVNWTPGNEETTWEVKCVSADSTDMLTLTATSNPFMFTGLQPATKYNVYVRAVCNADVMSEWSAPVTFTTRCLTMSLTESIYTEDFDSYLHVSSNTTNPSGYPNVDLPYCWTFLNRGEGSSSYPQAFLTSYQYYAVSGNALFLKSSQTTPLYAILPTFEENIRNMMISFVYRHEGTSSSNGTLSVGYITDPSDESTFVSLQDMEKVSTLTSVYVFLNTIPAEVTSANIAFKYSGGTSDNYNISIDDVIVQPITSCLTPQNLSVTEMDPHSVSLEWDDTGASAYQVAYAPSATFNLDSGLYQTVNLSTNSATISGLLENTAYTFAVRTDCGEEGFTSWTSPVSCKTPCTPLTTLPYTENFDSYSNGISTGTSTPTGYPNVDMPDCWTFLNRNGNTSPYAFLTSSSRYAESGNALFLSGKSETPLYAILPAFEENIRNLMISFTYVYESTSESNGTLSVGYMTDPTDASTFVEISSYARTTTKTTTDAFFNSVPTDVPSAYIAFRYTTNGTWYLGIDNVTVQPTPDCIEPQEVFVTEIGPNAISLGWTVVNENLSSHQVAYAPSSTFNLDSNAYQTLTSNTTSATVGGLTDNTPYSFAVRSSCGEGEWSEWSVVVSSSTTCLPITSLPYICSFETEDGVGTESNPMPSCWYRYNDGAGDYNYYPYVSSNSSSAYHGTRYLYFCSYTTTTYADNQVAVLPEINTSAYPMNGNQMVLWARCSSNPATIKIGTMTNPYDLSTFVVDDSLVLTSSYREYVVKFNSNGSFPAILLTKSSATQYAYVDNITIEVVPSCPKPLHVNVDTISETSATISWTSVGEEDQWEVKCVSMDSTDIQTLTATTNPFVFTGLHPATRYNVSVKAVCGDNEESVWSASEAFRTLPACEPITTLPYTCGFEPDIVPDGNNRLPDCWQRYNDSADSSRSIYPYVSSSSSSSHTGLQSLYFYNYTSSGYPDHEIAILPEISTSAYPMNGNQMVLWARCSSNPATIKIGTMTNPYDLSTFVVDDSLALTSSYREYVVKFNSTGSFPAILLTKSSATQYAYLDNITIEVAPSCPKPMHVNVDTITETSATISWTSVGEEDQWEVKCVSMDSTDIQTLTATTNPFVFTGLQPGTRYDFYVRAICGYNDESVWSAPAVGRTTPVCSPIVTLPYTENFDSYIDGVSTSASSPAGYPNVAMPDCWTFLNRSESTSTYPKAFLSSSTSYAASGNALFFQSSSSTPLYAVLPSFVEDIHNLMLSFTYRNEGTSLSNGTLSVGYLTNPSDASTFVELRNLEQITTLTQVEMLFDDIPSNVTSASLAFKYTGGTDNNYYLSIDEVMVTEAPVEECPAISQLPYTEDFNSYNNVSTSSSTPSDYPNVDLPECWTFLNRSDTSSLYPQAFLTSYYNYAVSGNALFFKSSENTPVYAVLPTFAEDIRNLMLSFTYRNEGVSEYNGTLAVGYLTNPADASTFVELRSFERTTTMSQVEMIFSNIPANVNASNIAFKYTGGTTNNYYLGIDDVIVDYPTCMMPRELTITDLTPTSVSLAWTDDNSNAGSYQVAYAPSATFNLADSEDYDVVWTNTNSATINGLSDATEYTFAVLTYCNDEDFSNWSNPITAKTPCLPLAELPYICGFEENIGPESQPLPECWYRYNDASGSSNYYPYVSYNSSYANHGNRYLNFYSMVNSQHADHMIAVLPKINTDLYPMDENQMVLWAKGTYTPTIQIGTMTDPHDFSTFVADSNLILTDEYLEYVVKFHSTGAYPAILLNKGSVDRSVYIDDITIEVVPSCPKPMYVTVDTITETSATISWTPSGEEAQWEVRCEKLDSSDVQTLTATANSLTLTGLLSGTRYNVYVRAFCSDNNWSEWSSPATFKIDPVCLPIATLPYTEDFNNYTYGVPSNSNTLSYYPNVDMPDCWTFLNRSESTNSYPQAFLTSYFNYVVSGNALFLKSSNTTPLYAVLPTFIENVRNLMLSFTYRNEGVSEQNGTLSVGYLTDPTDASTFVEIRSFEQTNTLTPVEVSFSEIPAGVTASNIAFKYTGGTSNNYYLSIDEVMVISVAPECAGITIPYNEDFESMTSGSTPNCWSFLPDVANATVPLVSAGSANAQSGDNSVYMTSRGILVLPEITNVENVNNLMMTFYVKQRKFAQRIAVGVMTDPNDPTTFTEIDRFFNDGNYSTPVQQTINFSSYSGSGKYIAFRNVATNSDAMSQNWIDDISITEIPPVTCEGITIPYYQNFDSITTNTGAPTGVSPDCWTFLPDVSNATIPQVNYGSAYAQSGNYSLAMTSRGIYVMPEITNVTSVNGLALSFYVRQKKYAQRIAVGVMSDPNDPSTFTEVERFFNDGNYSTPVYHIMDFSSYTGNGKYIAFRNVVTNSDALSQNWIDDINIFEGQAVTCNGITVPYEENFDSITTNTGTPTGASPACWTFLPDVDNATIPQVSYGTDNAQSGNYSLAMTSRGIYVMPEVTNIDNVSDLVMTFYVKQRKFAHRIAVGVMTDPTDPTTFVEIDRFYNDGNYSTLVQHSVNFSSYTGSGKYIAFRNVATNSDALSQNWIDNISLQEFCGITVPYVQNFDSLTTNTGTSTGASPRCWTFLPDVDNATIPQVSYGADNAQSGNYSLAMTSRGIYVMPEIINVDNVNNLTMTFYVKQRKFAHRIAVGVMTDPTDPNTFVEIDRFFNDGNYSTPVQQTVNFASYTGNGKYIAFRNVATNSDALSNNWIDDINITEAEAVACEGITIPYSENFDAITTSTGAPTGVSPACWSFLPDVDNATVPQISYGSTNAQSGNYSLAMTSRGIYALPEITNVDNISNLTMTFYVKQRKFASRIAVGVMTDPTDPNTFVEIDRFFNDGNYTTMVMQTVDFSSYTGNGKYIAFRNVTTSSDASSQNWIDDINISEAETVTCDGITVPYTQNFDAITSNTGAPTGVSPACWTFLPDVDGATIPQISYGSANAQSGNYSLAMTSRGIYALPEITNVESINGLTMTFYVKQRKYAHRIAVGVMSDPTDPNTFVEVERFFNGGEYTNLVQHTVDFSNYTGTGKYIAFRNVATNSDALSNNWIDDINISATEERSAEVEQTSYEYTDNDATNEVLAPTGVDDFDLDNFTVYPNPTTGELNLGGKEAKRVEVNSLTGQKVAVFENTSHIDISNLPSGVYILKVTLPQGEAVRKVVKR